MGQVETEGVRDRNNNVIVAFLYCLFCIVIAIPAVLSTLRGKTKRYPIRRKA